MKPLERIVAAAVRINTGRVLTGKNHAEIYDRLRDDAGSYEAFIAHSPWIDGFVTSARRFVDREEAFDIATRNDQVRSDYGKGDAMDGFEPDGELSAENLIENAAEIIRRLIHAEPLVEARGPTMKSIKKGKVKLSDAEHKKVMDAGAVWPSPSSGKKPVAAIWKSVVRGKTWYGCNTHRAYACKPTLRGAIAAFKWVKTTS